MNLLLLLLLLLPLRMGSRLLRLSCRWPAMLILHPTGIEALRLMVLVLLLLCWWLVRLLNS